VDCDTGKREKIEKENKDKNGCENIRCLV
jgi:hypothetical protein